MARAKRTERAEARRRYRATLSTEEAGDEDDDESVDEAVASASGRDRRRRSPAPTAPARPARPSLIAALRSSYRPLNLRDDIGYLPTLIRSRAVLIPLALTAATTAVLSTGATDFVSGLLYYFFVFSPPVGSAFLSGFLAKRASYMAGFIAGLAGGIGYLVLVLIVAAPAQTPLTDETRTGAVLQSLVFSPFACAIYAAAAAWYRRFLATSSAARRKATQKPAARRR